MIVDAIVKHWNEISIYRLMILPTPVKYVEKVGTYVDKSREVDSSHVISCDMSTSGNTDPIDVLKFYDEIEGSTLFLLAMLMENLVVFISFLLMTLF